MFKSLILIFNYTSYSYSATSTFTTDILAYMDDMNQSYNKLMEYMLGFDFGNPADYMKCKEMIKTVGNELSVKLDSKVCNLKKEIESSNRELEKAIELNETELKEGLEDFKRMRERRDEFFDKLEEDLEQEYIKMKEELKKDQQRELIEVAN